jgi:tyrosinase
MSIGAASATHPAVPLRHRLSVNRLTSGQVAHVRSAFAAAEAISDDRGYKHWAGIHGLPLPMYCTHGSPLFLPWHRAYLYFFELALRDLVPTLPGFALPWWDWTDSQSHAHGIPAAYGDQHDPQGHPNPLFSAAVDPVALQQGKAQGDVVGPTTQRQPDIPANLPQAADVTRVLALTDFLDFSTQLEDIHNSVHVWVGGHMSEIPFAAYDPVFWAHHCMIDRVWRLWQLQHPGASVPATLLRQALPPFSMTVANTLDPTSLGYDYGASAAAPHP